MPKIVLFAIITFVGEIAAYFVFRFVNRAVNKIWDWRIGVSVFKGVLERLFLFLSLAYNLPHALIAFGAIKIGTRVTNEPNRISNDYFFIGNIVSLLLVLFYYAIWLRLIR